MTRLAVITLFSTLGTFGLLLPSAGTAEGLSLARIESLSQGALPEVREYIVRMLGCSHWAGETSRDRLRTVEARRALRHLKCDTLEEDEAFLRKIYAGHAPSINALNAANGLLISTFQDPSPSPQSPAPAAGF
jgi:hypothetical protein